MTPSRDSSDTLSSPHRIEGERCRHPASLPGGSGRVSRRAFLRAAGLLSLLAVGTGGCSARTQPVLAAIATATRPHPRTATPPLPTVELPPIMLPAAVLPAPVLPAAAAPTDTPEPALAPGAPGAPGVPATNRATGAPTPAQDTRLIVIGDSIAIAPHGWPEQLAQRWRGGRVTVYNHAMQGARITGSPTSDPLGGMEGQVAAAAAEKADYIIVALGTNDSGATVSDLEFLGARFTTYLTRLQRDHPGASIYVMGILPGVIAEEGGRAAKQRVLRLAAQNRKVTFWETDGWINGTARGPGADTLEGLHPDATGHAKILAQVLALLPP